MVKTREVRKPSVDFHINDETMLETGKPVDFSFKKYKSLSSIGIESARSSRIGQLPTKSDSQKFLTRALWLNNNKLQNIENMNMFVSSVLQEPGELAWIDFSFNYIKTIDEIILQYPKLKIVYFHGNLIDDMDEIAKLKDLKELRSLTFHGNPIFDHPKYRPFVITILPQIVNLDFSPVLKSERLMPSPPEALRRLSLSLGFDDEEEDFRAKFKKIRNQPAANNKEDNKKVEEDEKKLEKEGETHLELISDKELLLNPNAEEELQVIDE